MINGFVITPFDAAAILIVLAASPGYLNHRFLHLPQTIGLTAMGAIASLIVVGLDRLLPGSSLGHEIVAFIAGIDVHRTLMEGMLSFLLFAGALHIDWSEMRCGRWAILILSTIGVTTSTVIVGVGFRFVGGLMGFDNVATAIIMGPLAIDAAHLLGVNPDAALLAVLIGVSSGFLTPIGHQNNLLVMGPGGYRFTDYARMGGLLVVLVVIATASVLSLRYG